MERGEEDVVESGREEARECKGESVRLYTGGRVGDGSL